MGVDWSNPAALDALHKATIENKNLKALNAALLASVRDDLVALQTIIDLLRVRMRETRKAIRKAEGNRS